MNKNRSLLSCALLMGAFLFSSHAAVTYVDSDLSNSSLVGGVELVLGTNYTSNTGGGLTGDNKWHFRTSLAPTNVDNAWVSQGGIDTTDTPDRLVTTFTLPAAGQYEIYGFFWVGNQGSASWDAGFELGNAVGTNTLYNKDNSTKISSLVDASNYFSSSSVMYSTASTEMYGSSLGVWDTAVDGFEVTVLVDGSLISAPGEDNRTRFDGVGYQSVSENTKSLVVKPKHIVTLSQAHRGDLEVDTLLLDSFGRLPEARRSFYLNAREILTSSPVATPSHSRIVEAAERAGLPLISGPMLGDLTSSGVTVWFRPVLAEVLTVRVADAEGSLKNSISVGITQPGAAARIRLTRLDANTRYKYWIENSAGDILGEGAFRTAPMSKSQENVRIAFGSCFHKVGVHNPNLLHLVEKRGNSAMLLLGDLAVDDREAKANLHYSDYLLRDVSKAWRDFSAKVPVYTSWDDHDYLNNDKSGLQKGQIENQERNLLRGIWQENWVNPQTVVEDRGIYFNTVIGDVEIIMLDTRSCRDWEGKGEYGSYLGEEQMQWLFKTLKASRARFILISSGTMWNDYMSKAKDSWGQWDVQGREEIYNFIEENEIGGVLLLSGDRHGARSFKIERPSGFSLYEFEAATLGGVPGPSAFAPDRSAQVFGYGGGEVIAFGEFTFDMSKEDPEVTFRLIDEGEHVLEKYTFSRSQLTPESADYR